MKRTADFISLFYYIPVGDLFSSSQQEFVDLSGLNHGNLKLGTSNAAESGVDPALHSYTGFKFQQGNLMTLPNFVLMTI